MYIEGPRVSLKETLRGSSVAQRVTIISGHFVSIYTCVHLREALGTLIVTVEQGVGAGGWNS